MARADADDKGNVKRGTDAVVAETTAALKEALAETKRALREAKLEVAAATRGAGIEVNVRLSRAEKRERTREQLLDAAAEVFAQKGYHGASMEDVAEAAGYTKGAVYSNFATKSDLFMALLDRQTRPRHARMKEGIAQIELEDLPAAADGWLAAQADVDNDWNILLVEFWLAAARDSAVREKLVGASRVAWAEMASAVEQKLADAGANPAFSGEELMILFDALGTGLLMNSYLDPLATHPGLFARAIRALLAEVPTSSETA